MTFGPISPGNPFIDKADDSNANYFFENKEFIKTKKNTADINSSIKEVQSGQTQTLPKNDTEILEKREHLIQVWMNTENMTREAAEALIDSIY